jgi:DME family drug/metabolite transporter
VRQSGVRPVLLVLAAAVCFGTTGTAQAFGPDAASSSAVGLMRIVVGGLLLGLVAWAIARRTGAGRPTVGRAETLTVLVGGAAVLAYQPTFFAGARLNGVAVAAVVTLGAAPVLTGVLEWVLTRQVPPRAWFVGTSCAVVGVVLIGGLLDGGDGGDGAVSLVGLAGSLGAALAYAVYTVAAKRLLTDGWSPTAAVGGVFATAAVMGAPFLLLVDLSWTTDASGAAMVAWLAVVTVVVAYVLFAVGLRALSASSVSTLTLVEPLTACVLGLVLLDEQLSAAGWAGLVALLGGVTVLAVRR